jgi:membrane protein implicated in regulation of membrane protease activity
METLNQLDPLLRTFWYVAIPASLVFLTQTILTFAGASHASDTDFDAHGHDGDGSDFQVFSFRNLINFLLGFGWSGISLFSTVHNPFLLIILALSVGVGFVWLFFLLIKQLQRLSEDNSFKETDTIGQTATVYLTIPASRTGSGKVHLNLKGSHHELDAMTDGEALLYGIEVIIIAVEGNMLIVGPLVAN